MKLSYLVAFISLLCISCGKEKKANLSWQTSIPKIGSQSSPLTSDLNSDGVLDIVIGAGENEYQNSAQGVLAIDGLTGDIIWEAPCKDQIFGSPTFNDINSDNIEDVIIGGRSSQLYALNGVNGDRIWEYKPEEYSTHPILKYANKNFYNSVLVPDSNGDGIEDILVSNGGNHEVFQHVKKGREAGVLLILDAKSGAVIASDTMPDGGETYMTPLYLEQEDGSKMIVFGSGGETFPGNLYMTSLEDLLNNDLSKSKIIASEKSHGFIAPPVFVDVTNDRVSDIIAVSHAGTISAIDGDSLKTIWQFKIPNTESSNGLAIGNFTNDDIPDIFTFVSKGKWPWNTGSYQIMLNGLTGGLEYIDSTGCPRLSSPVVYDINNDETDEVIFSLDSYDCQGFTSRPPENIISELIAINFKDKKIIPIEQNDKVKNIFTTPLLADIDSDGYLDIIHANYPHTGDLGILFFDGMNIKRTKTEIKINKPIKWGAYMGSNGDGIYK